MPNEETLPFYQAYVQNVKDFTIAETEIRRIINRSLKQNKRLSVAINTKLYALLYSTYSEARFMKMILTPYGFDQNSVDQILIQKSVQDKWVKCINLAFDRFNQSKKSSEIPNKKQELIRLVSAYIVDPSILRNKIAHGQLTVALNRENTNINREITDTLKSMDSVTVYIWFKVNNMLCNIIEELIESPDRAHYHNYYVQYQALVSFIEKSKKWTNETKLKGNSMSKPIRYNT